MSELSRLSVLVPLYNEAGTVCTLLERVRAVPIAKEVIVVDDGSSDGSAQVVEEYANALPEAPDFRLVLVRHERNQGKGAAVRTAIAHMSGDIAIIQDADLEYDPREYARLIAPIVEGDADVVYGSRFAGKGKQGKLSFWIANKALAGLTNVLYGSSLTDIETCYKVLRADVVKQLKLKASRFEIEPELTAQLLKRGYRIKELPIGYAPRTHDEGKKINWRDGFGAVWMLVNQKLEK